jgi:outer membrane lipoprotein-sorting protein
MLRFRLLFALILPGLLLPLTGCLVRTRNILVTTPPNVVISAGTSTLVKEVNDRYDAFNELTATVNLTAAIGHNDTGTETDYPTSKGYIVIRKPEMLEVVGLIPALHTTAFEMFSDGKTFTLYVPPKGRAVTGGMTVTKPSKNVLENLRPPMFLDSLLIRRIDDSELVSVTSDTRILDMNPKVHHVIQEPDYNLATYRKKEGSNQLIPLRVIHISRTTMLPYQLDIYNAEGMIETKTTYIYSDDAELKKMKFPARITIERPLDNLTVTLDILKLNTNPELGDDQFKVDIPAGVTVEKLQ